MAGLSIVLESQKGVIPSNTHHVISKTTIFNSLRTTSQNTTFLDHCFLCKKSLSPGNDIYMYKGDKAFCSEDCRCKQIFMDEEESIQMENCYVAAMRPASASPAPRHHR